jgi:hypothetical protein
MEGYTLTRQAKEVVRDILTSNNSGNYLEIGSYYGVMISELAEEFPSKIMYSIDPFIADGWTGQPKDEELVDIEKGFKINIAPYSNIKHYRLKTKQFIDETLHKTLENVTVVYVDGSHIFQDILIDIQLVDELYKKCQTDFHVIFDDLHIEDVQIAVHQFREKYADNIIHRCEKNNMFTFIMRSYNESKENNS